MTLRAPSATPARRAVLCGAPACCDVTYQAGRGRTRDWASHQSRGIQILVSESSPWAGRAGPAGQAAGEGRQAAARRVSRRHAPGPTTKETSPSEHNMIEYHHNLAHASPGLRVEPALNPPRHPSPVIPYPLHCNVSWNFQISCTCSKGEHTRR